MDEVVLVQVQRRARRRQRVELARQRRGLLRDVVAGGGDAQERLAVAQLAAPGPWRRSRSGGSRCWGARR